MDFVALLDSHGLPVALLIWFIWRDNKSMIAGTKRDVDQTAMLTSIDRRIENVENILRSRND